MLKGTPKGVTTVDEISAPLPAEQRGYGGEAKSDGFNVELDASKLPIQYVQFDRATGKIRITLDPAFMNELPGQLLNPESMVMIAKAHGDEVANKIGEAVHGLANRTIILSKLA